MPHSRDAAWRKARERRIRMIVTRAWLHFGADPEPLTAAEMARLFGVDPPHVLQAMREPEATWLFRRTPDLAGVILYSLATPPLPFPERLRQRRRGERLAAE